MEYLKTSGADVIGLNELTPSSKQAVLAALGTTYPYSVDCVAPDVVCDVMLLSRLPIENGFAGNAGAKFAYVARGDIEWQGRTVGIVATHPILPFIREDWPAMQALLPPNDPSPRLPGAPVLWQTMQMAAIAQYAQSLPPERIIMGDFNSVAWGKAQAAFRAATGLDNLGHFAPTWTLQLPFVFRTQIDHVFTGGDPVVTRFAAGPDVGSDHLPVTAEIALKRRAIAAK
jgi:endonuclease/exonuclease/phosphatase (EEP) superfamily protein YafD